MNLFTVEKRKDIFNRQLKLFINNLESESKNIVEYFNLNTSNNLTIEINPGNGYLNLKIVYNNNNYVFYFDNFPQKLSKYISEYNDCYIEIKLRIKASKNFPFYPEIWELDNINYRGRFPINIKKYYKYIIEKHNANSKSIEYDNVCIYLEKKFLLFLGKINYFEYFDPLLNLI